MNAPFTLSHERVREADLRERNEIARIERFVGEHNGTLFHRPAWLVAVERGTGQRATGLVAEQRGQITGWLPLSEVHSPLFGRALVSSAFAVGGGILAESSRAMLALARKAEELATRCSCASIELRGGVVPSHWAAVRDRHCGFVAPLAESDDALINAIPRKQRAEVRKSLNDELTVSVGCGEDARRAHYAVYAESVRNLGTPVFPRKLFDATLEALEGDILTVFHRSVPVASVLSFYHDGAVMPYWGGGTFEARALRANERMYLELMLHARRRGSVLFDFGRSKTGSGPYNYKKNWGFSPEPLTYSTWTEPRIFARDIDPNSPRHAARIALWKRLPLSLANALGPHIARGLG